MPHLSASIIWSILLAAQSTVAYQFRPRGDIEERAGATLRKRVTCEEATPYADEAAVFTDACQENPQNDFNTCFNQLVVYAQASAANTCNQYYIIYNDCLAAHNNLEEACTESRLGYAFCSNYTIQAYAYCGCYYFLPDQLSNCANVELGVNPASHPTPLPGKNGPASSGLLNGPIAPPGHIPIVLGNIGPSQYPVSTPYDPQHTNYGSPSIIVTTSCSGSNCTTLTQTTSSPTLTFTNPPLSLTAPIPSFSLTYTPSGTPLATSTHLAGPSPPPSPPPAGLSGQQPTSTVVTTVHVTRTSTITSCPATITACPAGPYSSESVYTTDVLSTILECPGGCQGPAKMGQCVVRQKTYVAYGM